MRKRRRDYSRSGGKHCRRNRWNMANQTTVVLNSKILFGESEVFDYIRRHPNKCVVVSTKRVHAEYIKEVLAPELVQTRLIELGKCHTKRQPAHLRIEQIPGLRKHHANFVLDACSAQCDYLVTRRQQWLELNSTLEELSYPLKIVTPENFLEEVGQ